jgi:hypothetical protein
LFNKILLQIAEEFILEGYWSDVHRRSPALRRALIQIHMPKPEVVDLFHNGAGGYRAQYYVGVDVGEGANCCVVNILREALKERRETHPKLKCDWDFIDSSLSAPGAKIWIHEGAWLSDNSAANRNLSVDRWEKNSTGITLEHRFEPSWVQLTPGIESRLDLKGGWIDKTYASVPSANKPYRGQEIHDFGYT